MLIDLLLLPFIQRALVAGLLLAILAGLMGVITLIRKTAFYGDAIAHSSLAGVALGLAVGFYPLTMAMIYAAIMAFLLPTFQKKTKLSLDNILGILLPFSMGLGVLIFSLLPGYQPEMMSFLFGSILTVSSLEVIFLGVIFIVSTLLLRKFLPALLATSLDVDYARLLGIKVDGLQKLYEVMLTVIVVAGVKLLGVILVNALLIIPASTAKHLSSSLKMWLWLSPVLSVIMVMGGMMVSLWLDTPPGATIAVFAGLFFILAQVFQKE